MLLFTVLSSLLAFFTGMVVATATDGAFHEASVSSSTKNYEPEPLVLELRPQGYQYFTNLTYGNPAKNFTVAIDISSREIMLLDSTSFLCTAGKCKYGSFDTMESDSVINVTPICNKYLDGGAFACNIYAADRFVKDTLNFAGHTFEQFEIGLNVRPQSPRNVLGIGFPVDWEQGFIRDHRPIHTFVKNLALLNVTPGATVSIRFSQPPSIIFGGIDVSAFTGDMSLHRIPRNPYTKRWDQTEIQLQNVKVGNKTIGLEEDNSRIVLNSNNFTNILPIKVVAPIKAKYDIQYYNFTRKTPVGVEVYQIGAVDCEKAQNYNENITFSFRKFPISVPLKSLVFRLEDYTKLELDGERNTFKVWPPGLKRKCGIAINSALGVDQFKGVTPFQLGTSVLRNVYMVLDHESHQVGLAHPNREYIGEPVVRTISHGTGGFRETLRDLGRYDYRLEE